MPCLSRTSSMTAYKSLKAQLARLDIQANDLKAREINKVLAKARELVVTYELTADQLGLQRANQTGARPNAKMRTDSSRKPKAPPKYRDPSTGLEWSGIGRRPRWIVSAGDDLSAFLIA